MSDRLNASSDVAEGKDALKIAAIPLDIRKADVGHNLRETERILGSLDDDTDLAVLPELFTTAFIDDPVQLAELAEGTDGPAMTAVRRLAGDRGMAIAGSFLCVEEGVYLNRGFVVTPSGDAVFYDKRHLFCLSPEASLCRAGRDVMPVVGYKGWNIAIAVCYDLRFPAWCRNRGQRYDVLLVPANWPQAREYAWNHLLIARAIENQAVVVGADRSGSDAYGCYDGLTAVYDPMGKPVGAVSGADGVVYATVSLERLRKLRRSLPFGKDADGFTLDL